MVVFWIKPTKNSAKKVFTLPFPVHLNDDVDDDDLLTKDSSVLSTVGKGGCVFNILEPSLVQKAMNSLNIASVYDLGVISRCR
jgi:hypothetical protein